MRRAALTLTALLLCAISVRAQKVELPVEVTGSVGDFIEIEARTDCAALQWVVLDDGLSMVPPARLKDSRAAVVSARRPGRYRLLAYGAKGDVASPPARTTVVVGGEPDPGPKPGPTPPQPSPAPIPVEGLRVLVVLETADAARMPAAQQAVVFSRTVRDYLNAKCAVGPDGKTREWRMWDKDVATDGEAQLWRDAMRRPRKEVPWLIISTGKDGYEGPLPTTVTDMMTLLKKYGGE